MEREVHVVGDQATAAWRAVWVGTLPTHSTLGRTYSHPFVLLPSTLGIDKRRAGQHSPILSPRDEDPGGTRSQPFVERSPWFTLRAIDSRSLLAWLGCRKEGIIVESFVKETVKPLQRRGVAEELVDQEVFLYDPSRDSDAVHCLNSGAAVIWLLCDGTRDVEGMASEIAATYSLPEEQVLAEVQETVAQFDTLGLLE